MEKSKDKAFNPIWTLTNPKLILPFQAPSCNSRLLQGTLCLAPILSPVSSLSMSKLNSASPCLAHLHLPPSPHPTPRIDLSPVLALELCSPLSPFSLTPQRNFQQVPLVLHQNIPRIWLSGPLPFTSALMSGLDSWNWSFAPALAFCCLLSTEARKVLFYLCQLMPCPMHTF